MNLDLLTVARPADICERIDGAACLKCGAQHHEGCKLPIDQVLVPATLLRDVSEYLAGQIDTLERDYTTPGTNAVDPEVTDEIAEVRGWIKQLRETASGDKA